MAISYEINVAYMGHHYFATHERSISTMYQCRDIYRALKKAFPESEGYSLSVYKNEPISQIIPNSVIESEA